MIKSIRTRVAAGVAALVFSSASMAQEPASPDSAEWYPEAELVARHAAGLNRAIAAGRSDNPAQGLTGYDSCASAFTDVVVGRVLPLLTSTHNVMVREKVGSYAGRRLLPEWTEDDAAASKARLQAIQFFCPAHWGERQPVDQSRESVQAVGREIEYSVSRVFGAAAAFASAMDEHREANGRVSPAFCSVVARYSHAVGGLALQTEAPMMMEVVENYVRAGTSLCS